ncbi:Plp2p KNAG_0G02940 [Huiozyma naganishii CBS 8797]|uniref:Phosducin domain-containing protein n=1 Tax=Huiozyma naganishii (strain ATCC MYA-139 / BCRC 22969 / CBS 8797 / KCTC 17520 / NBRC 10181 / NCYC 3082 / Yp74L-3) TaxID=1071383 RepID=J7S974_HUIN7|nr:hypothetical protein KNAG_0G02940 [Kazachstania naganishii CBS 8797]CCK71351.1 hypothetical protein KNAG_0G02940 [Kazachstania naganishii CBS 8797]
MNEPMFQVQVDESEDTEWNDILREKGVIPQRPEHSAEDQLEEAIDEAIAKQKQQQQQQRELDADSDDEFFEQYRRERFAQMQRDRAKCVFGEVYHCNKPEYSEQVTQASMGTAEGGPVYVFVHLALQGNLQSRILERLFVTAAGRFKDCKFVEIEASKAVEGYPDRNCPTLIVYHEGKVLRNIVTLLELGGDDASDADLERLMVQVGAIAGSDDRRAHTDQDTGATPHRRLNFVGKHSRELAPSDEDDEDDEDDFFN